LVQACRQVSEWHRALSLFASMKQFSVEPNCSLLGVGATLALSKGLWRRALWIVMSSRQDGLDSDWLTSHLARSPVAKAWSMASRWEHSVWMVDALQAQACAPDALAEPALLRPAQDRWQIATGVLQARAFRGQPVNGALGHSVFCALLSSMRWRSAAELFSCMRQAGCELEIDIVAVPSLAFASRLDHWQTSLVLMNRWVADGVPGLGARTIARRAGQSHAMELLGERMRERGIVPELRPLDAAVRAATQPGPVGVAASEALALTWKLGLSPPGTLVSGQRLFALSNRLVPTFVTDRQERLGDTEAERPWEDA